MSNHPKVWAAAISAVERHGVGAGGTRNISGTHHQIVELEAELADLHAKQAALVFTSGWISNLAGISTIASLMPDCLILSDALNHNSIIEGVRRSGREKKVWRHNDVRHLEELLIEAGSERPKLIVVEACIRWMAISRQFGRSSNLPSGIAPSLTSIRFMRWACMARAAAALPSGKASWIGSTSSRARWQRASARSEGISLPDAVIIDAVRSYAPQFIFTTSLPPMLVVGARAAVSHLKESNAEREGHHYMAAVTKHALRAAGLPVLDNPSHIVPVMVGDGERCRAAGDLLLNRHDVYIQPINYPTVPIGRERLRITPTPLHA